MARSDKSNLIASRQPATVADCSLDDRPILLSRLGDLTSAQIQRVVGLQAPGWAQEDARHYHWSFRRVPLHRLTSCTEDGEPEGGWKSAYRRHESADREAIAQGSPEYSGRQDWLKTWAANSDIYPVYLVEEDGGYRLWDGHHRVAAAFWHDVSDVAAFVGVPGS